MAKKQWQITDNFKGYFNKKDKSKLPNGALVDGSKNVVHTEDDLISVRKGYILLGASSDAATAVEGNFEWDTSSGTQRALRSYDDELEVLVGSTWEKVLDGWSAVDFQFAVYWDTAEEQDALLFVNGDSNIYYWSGAYTTFASATTNTLTKEGTTSWGEERFLVDATLGDTKLRILDDTGTWREFTYTGGETTTTLTGVTPDPTAFSFTAGARVFQSVRTIANKPASDSTAFPNDSIAVLNNQVYVGSLKSATVYMSKINDLTNFTPSATRLVGEGTSFNLDAPFVGFKVQEDAMYISAGRSQWYQILFALSDDNTKEEVQVKRLKSGTDQGALSQDAIGTIKNSIVFISNEPTLDTLGRIENIDNPQSVAISDPIKVDFDYYDFTGVNLKFYKNNLYIAVPANSVVLVYNLARGFWEAPWTMPAGRLAIIDDKLCLHSNAAPETYQLLTGYNDNSNPVECIARFAYNNYGERAMIKSFDEWYNEGYIQTNTTLIRKLYYDYRGIEGIKTEQLIGTDRQVLSLPGPGGIGKSGLGKEKFAGGSDQDDLRKFRWINEEAPLDFYEIAVEYSSNDIDQRWGILAFGPDIVLNDKDNNYIKN